MDDETMDGWKRRMTRFFTVHDSYRTGVEIDELLAHYAKHPGGFVAMLKDMIERYGPEPSDAEVERAHWRHKLEAFFLVVESPQSAQDIEDCLDYFEGRENGYEEMWRRAKEHFRVRVADDASVTDRGSGRSGTGTRSCSKLSVSGSPRWKLSDAFSHRSSCAEDGEKFEPSTANGVPPQNSPEPHHRREMSPHDEDVAVISPKVKVLVNIAGIDFGAFRAAGPDAQLRFNAVIASLVREAGSFPNTLIVTGVNAGRTGKRIGVVLETLLPDSARVCGSRLVHSVHGGTFPNTAVGAACEEHLHASGDGVAVDGAAVVESRMTGGFQSTLTVADGPLASPLGVLGDYKLPAVEESRQLALLRRITVDGDGNTFSYKLPVKDSRTAYERFQTQRHQLKTQGYVPSVVAYMGGERHPSQRYSTSPRSCESPRSTSGSLSHADHVHSADPAQGSQRARDAYERRLRMGGI